LEKAYLAYHKARGGKDGIPPRARSADYPAQQASGDVTIAAASKQNLDAGFLAKTTSTSISGASGGTVAVAGSLALVANANETEASIGAGVTLGSTTSPVGDVAVTADDTSRISAQALAGALSKGSGSEAGVGASFAVLVTAEMMGVKAGLGFYLQWAQGWAAYANMYAALLVMSLMCSGFVTLLFRVRDRVLSYQKAEVQW